MSVERDINNITRNLRNISEAIESDIKATVQDILYDLQRRAISRAPLDTGDLRGSSSTDVIKRGGAITGEIGFNTPYSLKQHEDLTLNHTEGEAKYLEKPLQENETRYKALLKQAVRRGLNG